MKTLELAKELAKSLAESMEYLNYKKAQEKLDSNESARTMVEDFRKKQWEYEQKRMNGDQLLTPLEDEIRKLSEIIGLNPYVREYLTAEYAFSKMMLEVQDIIAEAVGLEVQGHEQCDCHEDGHGHCDCHDGDQDHCGCRH